MTRLRVLVVVAIIVGVSTRVDAQWWRWFRPGHPTATGSGSLLSLSNLSCEGKFRIAVTSPFGGAFTIYGFSTTMRFDNGDNKRHWFSFNSAGAVEESVEPTLDPCNTAAASTVFATQASWGAGPIYGDAYGSDWGGILGFVSATSGDGLPGDAATTVWWGSLKFDATTNYLVSTWLETYGVGGNPGKPSFGASTLDFGTHTINPFGCWTTNPNLPQSQAGSGVIIPPAAWTAANSGLLPSAANYWIIGLGGPLIGASVDSMGPSLQLVPVPTSGNSCTSNVSYPVGLGKILSNYQANSVGPNCGVIGCTPSTAPTHPYPAQTSHTGYSSAAYATDWVPWAGHGWFYFGTQFGLDWYDDGTFHGVPVFYNEGTGWSTDTVLASPAPTYNAGTTFGSFAITSIDTHDGYHMNPGDNIWFITCTVGVDAGCDGGNADNETNGVITSVTGSGPYTINYTASGPMLDTSSGSHVPVVGTTYLFGTQYAHGDTLGTFARTVMRAQIMNPDEYVKVLNGTYGSADLPIYTEDADVSALFTTLGSPASGSGISTGAGQNNFRSPYTVIADPARHRIIVSVGNEECTPLGSHLCNMMYVLKVQ